MKINSIQNYNVAKNNKVSKNQNPSFQARVNILTNSCDSVSNQFVDLAKEPLKTLVNTIRPHLEKIMDNNLIINVSGVSKPVTLFGLFSHSPAGLKFSMKYQDVKRYYYEVLMKDPELKNIMGPERYEGLLKKDDALLTCFNNSVGIGRYYDPQKGDTPASFVKEVMPRLKEHLRMLPNILTDETMVKYDKVARKFELDQKFAPESMNGRQIWEKYRGIDYDYPRIMGEYYD